MTVPELVSRNTPSFIRVLSLVSLGLLYTCLMYKQNYGDDTLLYGTRLRGRDKFMLSNLLAVSDDSSFRILGHPSEEDKAARAIAKQETKKERNPYVKKTGLF